MKTVLITGVGRGIGLATAKKFLQEGWNVIGTFAHTEVPIADTNSMFVRCDQADPESIATAFKFILLHVSSLDALINNAAILIESNDSIADSTKVRLTLEVNVVGLVNFTEHFLPLLHTGSHIVNVGSDYGAFSYPIDGPWASGYRMSKAAVHMYTRQLAYRLLQREIIVSALSPGWVKTDMGFSLATETKKPGVEPERVAHDIFTVVTTVKESGFFWQYGEKRDW